MFPSFQKYGINNKNSFPLEENKYIFKMSYFLTIIL